MSSLSPTRNSYLTQSILGLISNATTSNYAITFQALSSLEMRQSEGMITASRRASAFIRYLSTVAAKLMSSPTDSLLWREEAANAKKVCH